MSLPKSLIRLTLSCTAGALLAASPAAAAPSWLAPMDIPQVGPTLYSSTAAIDSRGNTIAVVVAVNAGVYTAEASFRPVGGSWQAPVTLASAPQIGEPQLRFDGQGDAVVIWARSDDNTTYKTQVAVRVAATGQWRAAVDLCPTGESCLTPQIAVDQPGDAVAVWMSGSAGNYVINVATGSIANGTWEQPVQLSQAGASAYAPQAALDAQGDATALWYRYGGKTAIIQSAVRPANNASWKPPVDVSAPGLDAYAQQLAVDPAGDAVAVWESNNGTFKAIDSAVRIGPNGTWGAPGALSAYGLNAQYPQVTLGANGHALTVWERALDPADGHRRQAGVVRGHAERRLVVARPDELELR